MRGAAGAVAAPLLFALAAAGCGGGDPALSPRVLGRFGGAAAYGEAQPDPLVFSSDGRSLAAGRVGNEVRVWDLAAGRERVRFEMPDDAASPLAFSPDGRRVAAGMVAGSRAAAVLVLDAATGEEERRFEGLPDAAVSGAFSEDGRLLAAGDGAGTLAVWDARTGEERFRVDETADVRALRFSPDGSILAGCGGAEVALWDVATGKPASRFGDGSDQVESIAFSPDGALLAAADPNGRVCLWDTRTGRAAGRLMAKGSGSVGDSESPSVVAFSPDGRLVAAGTLEGEVLLWEAASGQRVGSLRDGRPGSPIRSVAFSSDGRSLAVDDEEGVASLWDLGLGVARSSPKGFEELWKRLAGGDAGDAWDAISAIAGGGDAAAAFLGERVAAAPADPARIRALLAALDDDDYGRRERAMAEIERMGPGAEIALRQALEGGPSADLKDRLGRLLDLLGRSAVLVPRGEALARLRGIAALERSGSGAARAALGRAAAGPPSAPETRAAKGALERLGARRPAGE